MTTTVEEALEQGWHQPTPTFFGKNQEDVMVHAGKCHQSPWVLMRRTEPEPVLRLDHRLVKQVIKTFGGEGAVPPHVLGGLPHFYPRPRPLTYSYFPEYRR